MNNKLVAYGTDFLIKKNSQSSINFEKNFETLSRARLTQLDNHDYQKQDNKYQKMYNYRPFWNKQIFRVTEDAVNRTLAVLLLPAATALSVIPITSFYLTKLRTNDHNLLFKQKRVGYKGNEFIIYKFRTIFYNGDYDNSVLFKVRFWGLDELPQLWNVIKGDMVLWGGRPLMNCELDKNKELEEKYLDYVEHRKPGMMSIRSLILRFNKIKRKILHPLKVS